MYTIKIISLCIKNLKVIYLYSVGLIACSVSVMEFIYICIMKIQLALYIII